MKMSKRIQYGLLLCFYLARSGTAPLGAIAENLGLSKSFLTQVAYALKKHKLVFSVRGPHGGYTLMKSVKVSDIMKALGAYSFVNPKDLDKYVTGITESRTLASLLFDFSSSLSKVMDRRIVDVVSGVVINELKSMEKVHESSVEH